MFDTEIVLGERYRDTVSGYEGVATVCAFFLHGCERVTLEQWNSANAELKELTFDAPRLVRVDEFGLAGKQVETTRTGGYKPDPPRRGANPR